MHKDDNYEMTLGGLRAKLRVNHDAREITVRLQDQDGMAVLRATAGRGNGPAIGASLRVDPEGDTDCILAGLYLGRGRVYVGARSPGLAKGLRALGVGRRLLSAELYQWDDRDVVNGATLFQAHLWSRDDGGTGARDVWVNLTDTLWGRCEHKDVVLEERDVVVTLPEAAYPCRARLIERTISRPRWPLQRFMRYVEFLDCAAVVPRRKSDSFAHIDDGRSTVEAQSIEAGIGAMTGRILQDRAHFGGKAWASGIPSRAHWQDSHKVSLTTLDRMGGEMAKDYTGPSFSIERDLTHGDGNLWKPLCLRSMGADFMRDPATGGLMVHPQGAVGGSIVERRGAMVPNPSRFWQRVFPGDIIRAGGAAYMVHFSPIGPPPKAPRAVYGTSHHPVDPVSGRADSCVDANDLADYDPNISPPSGSGETIAQAFGYVEQDVAAAVQDLAAHPEVSPSDESEGAAAREYIEQMKNYQPRGEGDGPVFNALVIADAKARERRIAFAGAFERTRVGNQVSAEEMSDAELDCSQGEFGPE